VTAPFISLRRRLLSPYVLTCEHAYARLPEERTLTIEERRILRSHWGWDRGAWQLTRAAAKLLQAGATAGRWSRLWVDLNREAGDATLVRRSVEGCALSWNHDVSAVAISKRFEAVHLPYHAEVDGEIAHRILHGVRPLLLAVHSFSPVLNGRPRNFDIGVLYDECLGEARRFAGPFRDAGLRVRYNEPYSGKRGMMYSIDRHGKHYGLPNLELELNQALFDDPRAAATLAPIVAQALRAAGR
jgi:predicted N-formylglutamate amidohydrolase